MPRTIDDFPPIPDSVKSDLEGDTIQNPNIAAYFSQMNRDEITNYYRSFFESANFFGIRIPSLRLNHPPEEAFQYVRNQQESTFLEQYVYPLRASIFVNGYEPYIENLISQAPSDFWGNNIQYKGNWYASKVTLRYYPVNFLWQIIIYLGIWIFSIALYKLFKKVLAET